MHRCVQKNGRPFNLIEADETKQRWWILNPPPLFVVRNQTSKKASVFYDSVWGGNEKKDALTIMMGLDWRGQG